jgi:hypothetical protein
MTMPNRFTPKVQPLQLLLTEDVLDKADCLERESGQPLSILLEKLIAEDFEQLVLEPTNSRRR